MINAFTSTSEAPFLEQFDVSAPLLSFLSHFIGSSASTTKVKFQQDSLLDTQSILRQVRGLKSLQIQTALLLCPLLVERVTCSFIKRIWVLLGEKC